MRTVKIIVGSKNPVKIAAAAEGFCDLFTALTPEVVGINVPSGIADQPMTSAETFAGAVNRAKNAKAIQPEANYWMGIEGGVEENAAGQLEVFAWIVAINALNQSSQARTASFYLPPSVAELVKQGIELGEADDRIFKKNNSKQQGGSVGILTNGAITRQSYYRMAITLAFIPFLQEDLYGPQQPT